MDEIARCAGHDGAYAVDEGAVILAVLPRVRVPKGEVLRIERALGDHRLIPCQPPANAVGRLEDVQSLLSNGPAAGDAPVARLRGRVGIAVLERHKAVRPQAVHHDVVFPRAVELEQAKFRLHPVDAVPALGVTGHLAVCRLLRPGIPMGCPVVHAVQLAVAKDRVVGAGVAFPRRIGGQHNFLRFRPVQMQFCAAGHVGNQMSIDKQLAPSAVRAKRQRLSGGRKLRGKQQRNNGEDVTIWFHGVECSRRGNFKSNFAKNRPCRRLTPPASPPAGPTGAR